MAHSANFVLFLSGDPPVHGSQPSAASTPTAMEPEPEPVGLPEGVPAAPATVLEWLQRVKLAQCHAALDETGYGEDIDMLLDGDEEEMADIVEAVKAIGVADKRLKGAVKKFMRELAKLRGQGEIFS